MLGGSTGINGLAWSKPHDFQLDALESVGNQGVNWDTLQNYMKMAEDFSTPSSAFEYEPACHSQGGPISIAYDTSS